MLTELYWKYILFCLLCNDVKSFPNIILCSSTIAMGKSKTFKHQHAVLDAFRLSVPGSGSEVEFATFTYIGWLEKHNGKHRWSDTL